MPESPAKDDHETAPENAEEARRDEAKQGAEYVESGQVDEDQGQDPKLQRPLIAGECEAVCIGGGEDTGPRHSIRQVWGREVLDNGVIDVRNCLSKGFSSHIIIQKQIIRHDIRSAVKESLSNICTSQQTKSHQSAI